MQDFAAFYEQTRPRVFRAVLVVTQGARDRVTEAVDEAFVEAWNRRTHLEEHPNPTAWVIRTAINQYKKWAQRVWRREIVDADLEPGERDGLLLAALAPVAASVDPDLLAALAKLPARQRQVVALRYLADLDPLEIGQVLGISAKTVSVHRHRAMQALRAAMEPVE